MKVRTLALALVPALLLGTGCSFLRSTAPDAAIPFARADYKLKGQTAAKACGTYIFGVNWGALFSDETASTRGGGGGIFAALFAGGNREEQAALWDALKKMPGATHVLKTQVRNTFSGFGTVGFPMFGKRCAEVVAHAVHMGQPFPHNGPSRGGVGENVSQWPVAGGSDGAPPADEGTAAVESATSSDEGAADEGDEEEEEEE